MNFFSDLHNSIFSVQFYKRIPEMSGWAVARFVLIVCVGTAFISGSAHCYYAFDRTKGLAAEMSALLKGMEFKNDMLDPHVATPFVPGSLHLSKVLNTLFCLPHYFDRLPDSFFVVDTASNGLLRKSPETQILLTRRYLSINPGSVVSFKIPYSLLLHHTDVVAEEEPMRKLLLKNIVGASANFIVQTGILNTAVFLLSIVFLAFAAYIFRLERTKGVGYFLAIASYAASPVYIGTNLVALSGVGVAWAWQILVLFSTFLMFRGVQANAQNAGNPGRTD